MISTMPCIPPPPPDENKEVLVAYSKSINEVRQQPKQANGTTEQLLALSLIGALI